MSIAVYFILIMMAIKKQYKNIKITHIKIFIWSIGISIDIDDTCLESTWYRIGKKIIDMVSPIPNLQN